jgi:hypothetical protein
MDDEGHLLAFADMSKHTLAPAQDRSNPNMTERKLKEQDDADISSFTTSSIMKRPRAWGKSDHGEKKEVQAKIRQGRKSKYSGEAL